MQTTFRVIHFNRNEFNLFKKSHLAFFLLSIFLLASCKKEVKSPADTIQNREVNDGLRTGGNESLSSWTVFSRGLLNPRGLKFGPDGNLYVAEGGTGGTHLSTGCVQVPFPVGPYMGSNTGGRISMINAAGVRTTITDQLPSSQANEIIGGDVEGVADVAFINNTLYALLAGGGCSHGVPSIPNGIVRINPDRSWTMVANLSAWLQSHPVQNPEPDDFEPDGTPYSMINVRDNFYVIEPNHGDLVKITTGGNITRVVDVSATQRHIVPTALAYHGNFYLGNLNTFPIVDGSSKIMKVTPSGQLQDWVTGLTTVLGVVFDKQDRMYVLENTVGVTTPGPHFPTPGFGKILRIDPSGNKVVIASGLSLPTGMTLGPDGNLYVSNWGFGPPLGQIIKVTLNN